MNSKITKTNFAVYKIHCYTIFILHANTEWVDSSASVLHGLSSPEQKETYSSSKTETRQTVPNPNPNRCEASQAHKGIKTGAGVIDKRGGDRKTARLAKKTSKVIEFASNLKACESHYARSKSKRLYLPSILSINKLFRMHSDSVDENLKVEKTFFPKISTKFNLGFGSSACDTCSYYFRTRSAIQSCEDGQEKQRLISYVAVHEAKAKGFHASIKRHCKCHICVQPPPKLNIGEAFYSRQVSFYCLCLTDVRTEHPPFYVWDETKAGRGAEEISSARTNFLQKSEVDNSITTIRLFADGCAGQNKNQHVVHALAYWLIKEVPPSVTSIVLYFPVADRVFGRVENKLRKVEEVLDPAGYYKIYKEIAGVRVLGTDWDVKNYKDLTTALKKIEGISEMKRSFLQKSNTTNGTEIKIKLEPTYCYDDISKEFHSMTKRGHCLRRDLRDCSI
nr:unnamed protein product [Callosobruchus chinensis]